MKDKIIAAIFILIIGISVITSFPHSKNLGNTTPTATPVDTNLIIPSTNPSPETNLQTRAPLLLPVPTEIPVQTIKPSPFSVKTNRGFFGDDD